MDEKTLTRNLEHLKKRVKDACERAGRSPESVKILLATKTVPTHRMIQAYQQGFFRVGENKAQELKLKLAEIPNTPFEWHFIGHLQTNKVKDVIDHCELIHSVDRESLALELEKRSVKKSTSVLIEVNTSGEPQKSGCDPNSLVNFCQSLSQLKNLRVKGLMTMAAPDQPEKARQSFSQLRHWKEKIQSLKLPHFDLQELSMGMSQDFEIAIEEGATLIRVGSLVFGDREP